MEWVAAAFVLWRQCLFTLLRCAGPVPRHVAFIMDGNRRFAKRRHLERYVGHELGSQKFVEVVRWCLEFGVPYVTVYAFSIENFKRSDEEVEELMQLARQEYKRFKEHGLVEGYEAKVRVIGDLAQTNSALQSAAARLMQRTHQPDSSIVHICFSYTSSQEMCRAMDISRGYGLELTENRFNRLCFTEDCPEVDVTIRTSGETRLSDFLNLQCRNALLVFDKVLWPDYSLWDFVAAMMQYQHDHQHLEALKKLKTEDIGQEVRTSHQDQNEESANRKRLTDIKEPLNDREGTFKNVIEGKARDEGGLEEDPKLASLLTALAERKRAWISAHARLP